MDLKPWQASGARFLAGRRHAILADEMRVGKTLTAIAAAQLVGARRILVACPAVARFNWASNFLEHLDVSSTLVLRKKDKPVQGTGVCITSYDLASADDFPGRWDVLICDEAHYLRNATAGRAQQLLGRDGLVHRAGFTWLLSGTPAVNHYGELWTALHVFGVYPKSYESFIREFCITQHTPYGPRVVGSTNHERLREFMGSVWLRRKLADVAPDMPRIVFETYVIEAPRGWAADFPPEVAAALESGDPVTALECLSEHTATVRRLVGTAKVPGAAELAAQDLDGNTDKLVLFTYHRAVAEALAKLLAEYEPALIYGGQTETYRAQEIARFQTAPECRIAIAQILAAGTAIDLSVADHAIFVEYDWVPGNNAQAAMRLQNFNKRRPVTARFLALRGSIDGRIAAVFRRKTAELTALFG